MEYRNLIYVFFCLLISVSVNAQKTEVSGRVFDAVSGEGLPYVNVAFQNSKIGTTTDLSGRFKISTYYATDTLIVSFVGYLPLKKKIKKDVSQTIDFEMQTGEVGLEEVVIKYKGNPADIIFDRIVEHKPANNKEKFSAYEYDVYSKVEFDLNNVPEDLKNRRFMKEFKFIFDYQDSSAEKVYLPVFMTEAISKLAYRKNPKAKKEIIMASKVSGIPDNNISKFLGDMYQNTNIYNNQVEMFKRSFVSPIANYGQRYYKYYLTDSAFIGNNWCYRLDFVPKRKQEPVFVGHFWVNDTSYAIKQFEAEFPELVNINYVRQIKMVQEFEKVSEENWMMTKDYLMADINLSNKEMGVYGRKTITYRNFVINEPRDDEFYSGIDNVIVDEEALNKNDEYWDENRHIPLEENEAQLYEMVDSLTRVPAFNRWVDFVKLMYSGYLKAGPIEFGKYYQIYSFNPVEGNRFRFGARTSTDFSKRLRFEGHVAYGTLDERYKYGLKADAMVTKKPRQILSVGYKDDLEQLGQSQNAFSEDNILSSVFRRADRDKLTNVYGYNASFEREWFHGFTTKVMWQQREMTALGSLNYVSVDENLVNDTLGSIKDANIGAYLRFSHREIFILSDLDRVSLGSDFPTYELLYLRGLSGVDNSQYDYDIVKAAISGKIKMKTFGNLDYRLEAGKYFGALPYPLLELHPGNESWFYDNSAYNLMNYFEFASDEYVSFYGSYHMMGLLFNRIPLFRRLKWREVVTIRTAWGRLDTAKHDATLRLPLNMYSLESRPYMEGSVGVENIFKIFRVDLLQRFTHLDHPDIATFGVRVMLKLSF